MPWPNPPAGPTTASQTSSSTSWWAPRPGLGTAVEAYHETLAELYAYFIPYPIELLHKSNCDEAVEIACKHVIILHRTMFMDLTEGAAHSASE